MMRPAEAERLIVFVRLQLQRPSAAGSKLGVRPLNWVPSGRHPQTAKDNRLDRGKGGRREKEKKRKREKKERERGRKSSRNALGPCI